MTALFVAALIGTVATLPTSLPHPKTVLPGIRTGASNGEILPSPNMTLTASLPGIITAASHYHIADTPLNLTFTTFGRSIASGLVFKTMEAAIDEISASRRVHPTKSITHGSFQHRYNDLEINVHEYANKQITWVTLDQLLLGLEYFTRNFINSRVLEFEIDLEGMGRVGYGSLRYTDVHSLALTERAVVNNLPQLPNIEISPSIHSNSSTDLPLPISKDDNDNIIFSFHLFGQTIPASAITSTYRLARHTISDNVRLHPNNDVPNGFFRHKPDDSRVELIVVADMDKQLTWMLLDNILEKLAAKRWGPGLYRELVFNFEIRPFHESYGAGSVRYFS